MSDTNEPVESIEDAPEMGDMGAVTGEPFSDEEIARFIDKGGEVPTFHPILQIWREVLKPARKELTARVTPQWASRICASHQQLTFADMNDYRDAYFAKIIQLLDILEQEIDSDADCLTYTTPEDDVENNSHHYKNVLLVWQMAFLQWELDWDCTSPTAAVELAAISEAHKMFFSQEGLTAFLDNIRFEYTEADSDEAALALNELKEGR